MGAVRQSSQASASFVDAGGSRAIVGVSLNKMFVNFPQFVSSSDWYSIVYALKYNAILITRLVVDIKYLEQYKKNYVKKKRIV